MGSKNKTEMTTMPMIAQSGKTVIERTTQTIMISVLMNERFARAFNVVRISAFCGRTAKAREHRFNPWTDILSGMERDKLLSEMARYKKVYAVGRTAIEAHALGCEVLFYDQRFRDPSFWKVVDSKDAAFMLQTILDAYDGY